MSNPWAELVQFTPEEIEDFVEHVFAEYGQGFKPIAVDAKAREVQIELKDGRKVKEKI